MKNVFYKTHLQLVMNSSSIKYFPSWKGLQQKKKNIILWIWIDAALLSMMTAGMITEVWEKFEQNWFATVFTWMFLSAAAMFLYVISAYHTIYLKFRQMDRELKKLIFQDLLIQLKREKYNNQIQSPGY